MDNYQRRIMATSQSPTAMTSGMTMPPRSVIQAIKPLVSIVSGRQELQVDVVWTGMAKEIVVRDFPSVRPGVAKHHYVPDPDSVHRHPLGQDVFWAAQLAHHGDEFAG